MPSSMEKTLVSGLICTNPVAGMTLCNELMPILIRYKIKMGIFLSLPIAVMFLVLLPVMFSTESVLAAEKIVGKAHGKFFITADNISIGSIAAAFDSEFDFADWNRAPNPATGARPIRRRRI